MLLVHNRALVPRRNQVYTFGEGDGGRLGHGDEDSRAAPTLVASFEDEPVEILQSTFTHLECGHRPSQALDSADRIPAPVN